MSDAEPKRTPANQNPWYVLMTLYGEQEGIGIDAALHEKNRDAWNTWAGFLLPIAIRRDCAATGIALQAPDAWHDRGAEIRTLHRAEMLRRNGPDFSYPGFPEPSRTERVDFSHVDLPCHFWAEGLVFPAAVSFDFAKFSGEAQFRGAKFSEDALFDHATFSGKAQFSAATFSGEARFPVAKFRGEAEFGSVTFSGEAQFGSATFSGDARFGSATFSGAAVFFLATFSGDAKFVSTKFVGAAVFFLATFSRFAWFLSATFSGDAGFDSAKFGGYAGFASATFSGAAEFASATFGGGAWFHSATFSGFTYFSKAQFGTLGKDHTVTFSDCQFLKPTSFRETIFHSQYPDLSGAVLHDKTEFTARPENWPLSTNQPAEDAKASCARIRHALGKQGLPEDEHFFYRREMGFACRIGTRLQRLPYRLFGLLSDFGYSIQRPAEALLLLWVYPAVFFFGHAQNGRLSDWPEIFRALALSFANIFNFLGFHRTFFAPDYVQSLPGALQFLSGFQAIAAVVLLFFLGLGLRTRFRLH